MAWHYNANEMDVISGLGIPTTTATSPTLYVDRLTGQTYLNKGGNGTTWVPSHLNNVETLTANRTLVLGDSGKTFFLNAAGGFTITLPVTTTAAGFRANFFCKTSPTTAYIITGSLGSS